MDRKFPVTLLQDNFSRVSLYTLLFVHISCSYLTVSQPLVRLRAVGTRIIIFNGICTNSNLFPFSPQNTRDNITMSEIVVASRIIRAFSKRHHIGARVVASDFEKFARRCGIPVSLTNFLRYLESGAANHCVLVDDMSDQPIFC